MKLREIYIVCKKNLNIVKGLSGSNNTVANRTGISVTGWGECLKAIQSLKRVPSLGGACDNLVDSVPFIFVSKNSFSISNEEWGKISKAKNELLKVMDDIVNLCEEMGMTAVNEVAFDVKLPKTNNFSDFVKCINELEFIFSKCTFLQKDDEKIVFENVDVGSTWLTFIIVGGAAIATGSVLLNNLAAFIDKCIVIRSHYLTTKKQKMDLEKESRDEDSKKVILEYIEDLYRKSVANALYELEDKTRTKIKNEDGDEWGRNKECLERLGKLIEQGLQIYAAIDAPVETQKLFKPLEMKYLTIGKDLKLLETKEEKEE